MDGWIATLAADEGVSAEIKDQDEIGADKVVKTNIGDNLDEFHDPLYINNCQEDFDITKDLV
jgi:hypothetical protein